MYAVLLLTHTEIHYYEHVQQKRSKKKLNFTIKWIDRIQHKIFFIKLEAHTPHTSTILIPIKDKM